MKREITLTDVQYIDSEHESALQGMKDRITTKVELQGKQHGEQNKPKTPDEHQALVLNQIEITVQEAINYNQQRFLPISGVAAANLIRVEAEKREGVLQRLIADTEHSLSGLEQEIDEHKPEIARLRFLQWIFWGLVFLSVTEGVLSYSAFRHYPLNLISSIFASLGVSVFVGMSTELFAGYIQKARSASGWIFRYGICLIPAILIFLKLGEMRVRAVTASPSIHIRGENVSAPESKEPSALAIAAISIVFYAVGLAVCARYRKTDGERIAELKYRELCKKGIAAKQEIRKLEDELRQVRDDKVAEINLALRCYEYALYIESRLMDFAQIAAQAYIQKNIRFRTDGCPAFFSRKPHFHFKTFFYKLNIDNHEIA